MQGKNAQRHRTRPSAPASTPLGMHVCTRRKLNIVHMVTVLMIVILFTPRLAQVGEYTLGLKPNKESLYVKMFEIAYSGRYDS